MMENEESDMNSTGVSAQEGVTSHTRIRIWIGAVFIGLSMLFLMALVFVTIVKPTVVHDQGTRFLIVAIIAIAMAAGVGLLGGGASIIGRIQIPSIRGEKVDFNLAGGIAVFVTVMVMGELFYLREQSTDRIESTRDMDMLISRFITTYKHKHSQLDSEFVSPNLDTIISFQNEAQYAKLLNAYFETHPDRQSDLVSLMIFYEEILQCEKSSQSICTEDSVDLLFGKSIAGFKNTYGPYLRELAQSQFEGQFSLLLEATA